MENFRPVLLLFAALLVYSAGRILVGGDEEEDEDLEKNFIVATTRRILPVSAAYDGDRFFTLIDGERSLKASAPLRLRDLRHPAAVLASPGVKTATPLLLTLVVIELSDIVFAVDSIPAVFGVTKDPFIVYSSNMFAILAMPRPGGWPCLL